MSIPLIPSIILLAFSAFSSLLLIVKGNNKTYQLKFLGGTLLIYSLFFLTYALWFEFGLILKHPHLLGIFSPVMFLLGPLFYISIRNIVFGISGFKKKDWVHLIPALIHSLELIPLYALPASEKLLIGEKIIAYAGAMNIFAHGFIPGIWIDLIRVFLFVSYFLYSIYLVFEADPALLEKLKYQKFKNWLYCTLVFFGIIHVGFIILYLHAIQFFFTGVSFLVLRTVLIILMLLAILAYNIYNFIRLEMTLEPIGELPNLKEKTGAFIIMDYNSPLPKPVGLTNFGGDQALYDEAEIRDRLTKLFEEDQIFLKQGLLVSEFAKKVGITSRYLPEVLKKNYGKGFKDLINQYRVNYAKEKIESGYLDVFTLESLGKEAGFNSRTTFFNAFKKELNLSPSDFWKRFQEGPSRED